MIRSILNFAYLKGVSLLDTAEAYGDAQRIIGEYHKMNHQKFNVITKFSPFRKDLSFDVIERVNNNLTTLNINSLYSYMFHSYKDYKEYFPLFKNGLIKLQSQKKIIKIGVSLHLNDEITEVLKNDDIGIIQLPFNLLDNSNKRKEILLEAKQKGVEIHTRSVFLQGLFFKDPNEISGDLLDIKEDLKMLNSLVLKENINDLAINYVYSKEYIDGILLGVDNIHQLKSNFDCLEFSKTKSLIAEIDKINITNKSMLNPVNWNQ